MQHEEVHPHFPDQIRDFLTSVESPPAKVSRREVDPDQFSMTRHPLFSAFIVFCLAFLFGAIVMSGIGGRLDCGTWGFRCGFASLGTFYLVSLASIPFLWIAATDSSASRWYRYCSMAIAVTVSVAALGIALVVLALLGSHT